MNGEWTIDPPLEARLLLPDQLPAALLTKVDTSHMCIYGKCEVTISHKLAYHKDKKNSMHVMVLSFYCWFLFYLGVSHMAVLTSGFFCVPFVICVFTCENTCVSDFQHKILTLFFKSPH